MPTEQQERAMQALTDIHQEMEAYEKLCRVAELSERIALRLAGHGWTKAGKREHAADLAERDAILISVRPSYQDCIALRERE